jgi:hypothetical protein
MTTMKTKLRGTANVCVIAVMRAAMVRRETGGLARVVFNQTKHAFFRGAILVAASGMFFQDNFGENKSWIASIFEK